jgi:glycosyltransferase involved in cell wall biosynthesis
MKFSVIIPSRIVDYPSSAKNKDQKLIRAVNSVLAQTFEDYEVHIIADGCQKTVEIIEDNIKDTRIHLWKIQHKKLWSGLPRNKGIEEAKGEFIIYLDIDDIYGDRHLEIINNNLGNYDWVWFDDIRYKPRLDYWYANICDINKLGRHGTSNLCHRRSLDVMWPEEGKYAHDYHFTRRLIAFKNYAKIQTPLYIVCHVPGTAISGGYDI